MNLFLLFDSQHNFLAACSSIEIAKELYYSKYPHHKTNTDSGHKPIIIPNYIVDNLF